MLVELPLKRMLTRIAKRQVRKVRKVRKAKRQAKNKNR